MQSGHNLDLRKLKEGVDAMVDSILRNPAAFTWVKEMKRRDIYSYYHALGCAIWAASFGRHLGLEKDEVQQLSLGGLLCDVGMTRLPVELVNKQGALSKAEAERMRQHTSDTAWRSSKKRRACRRESSRSWPRTTA